MLSKPHQADPMPSHKRKNNLRELRILSSPENPGEVLSLNHQIYLSFLHFSDARPLCRRAGILLLQKPFLLVKHLL